jgi:pimeloyl-ACP methyl ester carboxylesterase
LKPAPTASELCEEASVPPRRKREALCSPLFPKPPIDDQLERLRSERGCQRVVIRGADHGMWFQQPHACRKAVLEFLGRN